MWGSVSLGLVSSKMSELSHLFLLPLCVLHQKCYSKVLLWPFPALRRKLSPWARGTLQFWIYSGSNSDWAEPAFPTRYSKDTRLTAPNKAHQISDPHGCHRQKRQFYHKRGSERSSSYTRPVISLRGTKPSIVITIFCVCFCIWGGGNKDMKLKKDIHEDYILHISRNFKKFIFVDSFKHEIQVFKHAQREFEKSCKKLY